MDARKLVIDFSRELVENGVRFDMYRFGRGTRFTIYDLISDVADDVVITVEDNGDGIMFHDNTIYMKTCVSDIFDIIVGARDIGFYFDSLHEKSVVFPVRQIQ